MILHSNQEHWQCIRQTGNGIIRQDHGSQAFQKTVLRMLILEKEL
jgi:hypothetical protein